ncbi:hypothetical protein J2801_002870 [Paraburkholderia phenoliruptrix]|uniref:hypothetical protein n=1 Tax=Paraburkholderia phenoliruptrix TaxID=252970 RepID=UPI0001C028CE|nr:hypothetical protein [Paraburkholderia phenoliruptrix]MDR6420589.1 hypothetical protein [Paraburkholderia phenoliruptrix]
MAECAAVADPQRVREHAASSRNPPGRFPVQFLIFVLSQKPAGAAFIGHAAVVPG